MGVYTTDQLDALRAILAKARRYADEDPEVAVMQVRKTLECRFLGESASPRALQDIDALADEDAPAGLRALDALIDWAASELQGEEVDDFLVDEVDDFLDDGPSAAERYTEAVRHELSSGTLSAEGKQGLSRLRRELGLSADEAKQIFQRAREGSTADSPQAEPSGPPEMTRVEPTTLLSQLFEEETGRRIPMRVSLSAAFELGASPVSPALWSEVMGEGMTSLSFLDAVVFCNRLSELHGLSPPYELLPRFEQARAARDLDAYGQCPPGSVVAWRVYANGYRLPTTAERYARPDLAASAELCYDGAVYPFLEADPSGVVEDPVVAGHYHRLVLGRDLAPRAVRPYERGAFGLRLARSLAGVPLSLMFPYTEIDGEYFQMSVGVGVVRVEDVIEATDELRAQMTGPAATSELEPRSATIDAFNQQPFMLMGGKYMGIDVQLRFRLDHEVHCLQYVHRKRTLVSEELVIVDGRTFKGSWTKQITGMQESIPFELVDGGRTLQCLLNKKHLGSVMDVMLETNQCLFELQTLELVVSDLAVWDWTFEGS